MFAYVGSFTTEKRKARGKGISVYRVEAAGAWTLVQTYDPVPNPGFLALDRRGRFLYAAHGDSGEVTSYAIDPATRKIELLNRQPTAGNNSPHVTVDPDNRCVVLANGPGIAVCPIREDGTLAPATDTVIPPGEAGPYRREQGHGAHPHQVVFDASGRFLVAPDKGVDRVHLYRLDNLKGKLVPGDTPFVKTRYGAGPRHIAFHPKLPYAYLVNELDSTVTTYRWDSGRGELTPSQVITTLPTSFTGDNTGAEIAVAPSGSFVFVSNRGHDSIVTFAVDQAAGTLSHVAWEPTQGKKPRFFTLDPTGNLLYAANENSDTIVAFRIDQSTGKLTPTGQVIETGSPSCVVFAD